MSEIVRSFSIQHRTIEMTTEGDGEFWQAQFFFKAFSFLYQLPAFAILIVLRKGHRLPLVLYHINGASQG